MKHILKTLLWLWQLPQNMVGLVFLLFLSPSTVKRRNMFVVVRESGKMRGGVSLGRYVYLHEGASMQTERHEAGHCIQSIFLGPLYLIVIGLPSLLWAGLHRQIAPGRSYYWFYTERWADRLGRVSRE